MKKFLKIIGAILLGLAFSVGLFAADAKPQVGASSAPTATMNSEVPKDTMVLTDQKASLGTTQFVIARHGFSDVSKLDAYMKMLGFRQATPLEQGEVTYKLGMNIASYKNAIVITKLVETVKTAANQPDSSAERPKITRITVAGKEAAIVGLTNHRVFLDGTEFIIAKHTYGDTNELAQHLAMMGLRNVSPTNQADVLAKLGMKLEKGEIVVARLNQPAKTVSATDQSKPKPPGQ